MVNVFLISYYWPPASGAGVHRWLKMSKYFFDQGIKLTVFTVESDNLIDPDHNSLSEVHPSINVHKIPIWEPFNLYFKFTGKKKKKVKPGFLSEDKNLNWKLKLSLWIRANFFIPDAKMFWILPARKYIKNHLSINKADCIISTGPPHSLHLIAKPIAKKFKIKWIADFRDPWTEIDYIDKLPLTRVSKRIHEKLERSILQIADEVVTVSWIWAKRLNELSLVNKNIHVITNGFDHQDFDQNKANYIPSNTISIVQTGSMYEDRNVPEFWKALSEIRVENKTLFDKIQVLLYGSIDSSVIKEVEKYNLESKVSVYTDLPHSEIIKIQQTADILLLPINRSSKVRGIIPMKLYEYLGAGRPVLAIGDPLGDAFKVLNRVGSPFNIEFGDSDAIKKAIHDLEFHLLDHEIDEQKILQFKRQYLAKQFSRLICS